MKAGSILTLLVGVIVSALPVTARGGEFDFQYVYPSSASAGSTPILDTTIQQFELDFELLNLAANPNTALASLELEIGGLTHASPGDINIFLLPPVGNGGNGLEIMDDSGGQSAIDSVNLVFLDGAAGFLPTPIVAGTYRPEGLSSGLGSFSQYLNGPVYGTAPWRVLVIDDSAGGAGSFDSITLRGTYVPEPATLSLLMLGALAMLRRRR